MQMRFNKKGQEGFSTTGVLAMVVGVIALVVIGIFIYNAYSQPKEIANLLPDEFQKALLYCENVASNLPTDNYCLDYKEFSVGSALSSKTYYYNCADLEKQAGKTNTKCGDTKYAQSKCLNLALAGDIDDKETVYVSDKACTYTAPTATADAKLIFNTAENNIAKVEEHPQFATTGTVSK